jgi:hypothetical protein
MFRYASLLAFVATMPFGAVADLSEQETVLMTATPIAATLKTVRFISVACASSDALQSGRWNFPNNPVRE